MMEMIGPKPRWQYRKIELLNELNRDITEEAEKQGWHLSRSYAGDMSDLDRDCDPMNVHGWIQNQLDCVEENLAEMTEEILNQNPDAMKILKDTSYRFGYRHAEDLTDAVSAYQLLDDVLLNGMPCDDVNEITEQSSDKVSWYEKQDMHAKYWQKENNYRELRNAVTAGLLAKAPVTYSYDDNHQSIVRNQASL